MKLLDLFAGMGGLSKGFKEEGYNVCGVDINKYTARIFHINSLGEARIVNLKNMEVKGKYDLIIGGPPCRPWSSVNIKKRRKEHEDFILLKVFFNHISKLKPIAFIMENVPPARKDTEEIAQVVNKHYMTAIRIIRYSDFGAPIRRRRMFMVGFRKDTAINVECFFEILNDLRSSPMTVRDAIEKDFTGDPDHVYPRFKTINKYEKYYRTGKYGWYKLKWDEPAPSFGNIMKTYILHPDSSNGISSRVISVKEAMCIMGFPEDFRFPEGMPIGLRYQMVADAVSPTFSNVLAKAIKVVMNGIY